MADNKDRANAQFDKLQRAEAGKKNVTDYEAAAAAVRAKTARLKVLRLARDAAEGKTVPAATPGPVKATRTKGKGVKATKGAKGAAGSLSDWLKAEQGSGRNN